jgi:hypothetical protein
MEGDMALLIGRRVTLAMIIMLCAGESREQAAAADDVLAPLVAIPIASPNPVHGADGRTHLVYEIALMSMASSPIALKNIESLDAESGTVVGTLQGEGLAQMLRLNGGTKGIQLSAGGSGLMFMDVTLEQGTAIPKALKHRFTIAVSNAVPSSSPGDRDPTPHPTQDIAFVSDALEVGARAVVISPPLKGSRWVVGGGCCTPYSYHRGATLPINGAIHVAERYAIDFVQLNDNNMLNSGPPDRLSSYAYFGNEIYSVADGTVVATKDDLPEQVPGKLPEGATIQMAAGNHVVVDIGEGRFAFYAHMQPKSLKVRIGDKVVTGQVLGLLGNSGNTDTPHLHFHVMDGPSPLVSNGLPYVFSAFTGQGMLKDEKPLFTGGKVSVDEHALAGPLKDQLPLNDQVVSFP